MGKGCSDHAEISLRRASDKGSRRPPMAQSSEDGFPLNITAIEGLEFNFHSINHNNSGSTVIG
ncbi:hypothetical protein D4R89_02960 [bacterium]|nr:MAG: hypothetical protein D4R89_02960 [bacterium]